MQYCEKCGVYVMGTLQNCPLCQGPLSGESDPEGDVYPNIPLSRLSHVLPRVLILASAIAAAACTTVFFSPFSVGGAGCPGRTGQRLVHGGNRGQEKEKALSGGILADLRPVPSGCRLGCRDRFSGLVAGFCPADPIRLHYAGHDCNRTYPAFPGSGLSGLSDDGHFAGAAAFASAAMRRTAGRLPSGGLHCGQSGFAGGADPV